MDRQHRRLAGHHDPLQAGRRVLARAKAEERGVQVARGQPIEQRVGLILHERQLDAGVLASERADGADDAAVRQRHDEPDAELAGDQPAQRGHGLPAVLDLREGGARLGQQRLAG